MEFAEFIKTPKIDTVVLHKRGSNKVECSLCVTGHHLILSTRREDEGELWLLHQAVDHVERWQPRNELKDKLSKEWNQAPNGGVITLHCKNLRILKIEISGHQDYLNVADSIEKLSKVNTSHAYAFFYRPLYNILEDGYTCFQPEIEYAKLLATGAWRLSKVNEKYDVCPTYGKNLLVPTAITDEEIVESAKFRENGRFPVISYKHGEAILIRSAPIVTQNGVRRCTSDEMIVNIVLGRTTKGLMLDTRHGETLAKETYTQWKKKNVGIKLFTQYFTKFMEACNDTSASVDKFLNRLEGSQWLNSVHSALNAACITAQSLEIEGSSVFILGYDTTLIVTALVQIILNPDCRTIRGFIALIDREFLQGGYPFSTRHRYSCYSPQKSKSSSPGFLLFLDCVYQLHYQFSCSFEFKINLLIMLFENSYFSQYGTFLGDCEKEREELGVYRKTTSYWTHLFRPEIMDTILSPVYDPNVAPIWPSIAPCSIMIWEELYFRWVLDQKHKRDKEEQVVKLINREKELKQTVIKLRKELVELELQYAEKQNSEETLEKS